MHAATMAVNGSINRPLLGICLGHQALGLAAGMKLAQVPSGPVHGSPRKVRHDGSGVFEGFTSPHPFTLYNSLIVMKNTSTNLEEIAWNEATGDVMAVRHPDLPIFGVQFHPESVGSENGIRMLSNFLQMKADA
jgi:anthranilate synthase/aminodeoxychorismate synthase-like glutamine amidotransferase